MKADGWDRQGASETCQSAGLAPSCRLPLRPIMGSQRLLFRDGRADVEGERSALLAND